jgi:hypothetical protein
MSTATEEIRISVGGWACTKVRLRDDEEHLNWTPCYARIGLFRWQDGELHITSDRFIWTPRWIRGSYIGALAWLPFHWAAPTSINRTDIVRVIVDEAGLPGVSMPSKWKVDTLQSTWIFSFGYFGHTKRQQWIDAINEWAFAE